MHGTLSDLSGQDAAYHGNDGGHVVKAVRKFLASKAAEVLPEGAMVRGDASIALRLSRFRNDLPAMAAEVGISEVEINTLDYLPEWLEFATRWQVAKP